jgi:hypothetical protein
MAAGRPQEVCMDERSFSTKWANLVLVGLALAALVVLLAACAPPVAPMPTEIVGPAVTIVVRQVSVTSPPTLPPPTATPRPTNTPRPTFTPRATLTPVPTRVVVHGQLADLVAEDKLEIQANGRGLESLDLDLRSLIEDALEVEIPAGTLFVAETYNVQNMVVRRTVWVTLEDNDWLSTVLDVACANLELHEPGSEDGFGVRGPDAAPDGLSDLVAVLAEERPGYDIEQAAIWIVTDNADYDDLGILISGFGGFGSRVIDEDVAARAMQLVDAAGIDLTRRAIWRDRLAIADGCDDLTLGGWLRNL